VDGGNRVGCSDVACEREGASQTTGPIRLIVDASQAPQKILHVKMEIPVSAGALTLYYPEWIPGEHMPDGPSSKLLG